MTDAAAMRDTVRQDMLGDILKVIYGLVLAFKVDLYTCNPLNDMNLDRSPCGDRKVFT